ncbi:hypothetical protein J3R83DRAFT_5172 [Lanmaoa asiatica]|nr:hypothetical protein J3R83DRAFT_5172 [Lanmaoa asiatica]
MIGPSWTLEDLESHLEALVQMRYSIVTHSGKNDISMLVAIGHWSQMLSILGNKGDGSVIQFGVDRSGLPGDLASDITSDKKPDAHGSSANVQRITDPRILPDELGVTDESSSRTTDPDRTCKALQRNPRVQSVARVEPVRNQISNDAHASRPGARPCTLAPAPYRVDTNGHAFDIYDIPVFGNEYAPEKTIGDLYTERGIDLLVYCLRPKEGIAKKIYNAVRSAVPERVPMVGVVTGLEKHSVSMEDWWSGPRKNGDVLASACVTTLSREDVLYNMDLYERRYQSMQAVSSCLEREVGSPLG